jgi:hypothetical protein
MNRKINESEEQQRELLLELQKWKGESLIIFQSYSKIKMMKKL